MNCEIQPDFIYNILVDHLQNKINSQRVMEMIGENFLIESNFQNIIQKIRERFVLILSATTKLHKTIDNKDLKLLLYTTMIEDIASSDLSFHEFIYNTMKLNDVRDEYINYQKLSLEF